MRSMPMAAVIPVAIGAVTSECSLAPSASGAMKPRRRMRDASPISVVSVAAMRRCTIICRVGELSERSADDGSTDDIAQRVIMIRFCYAANHCKTDCRAGDYKVSQHRPTPLPGSVSDYGAGTEPKLNFPHVMT
jgi:hypothetical protein